MSNTGAKIKEGVAHTREEIAEAEARVGAKLGSTGLEKEGTKQAFDQREVRNEARMEQGKAPKSPVPAVGAKADTK